MIEPSYYDFKCPSCCQHFDVRGAPPAFYGLIEPGKRLKAECRVNPVDSDGEVR